MAKKNDQPDPTTADAPHPDTIPAEPPPAPEAPALELPEMIPPEGPTIEAHALELGTHPAILAAMKAYFLFGEGRKMSREHYELAIHKVENLQFQ
jgi:hypothetical protein